MTVWQCAVNACCQIFFLILCNSMINDYLSEPPTHLQLQGRALESRGPNSIAAFSGQAPMKNK